MCRLKQKNPYRRVSLFGKKKVIKLPNNKKDSRVIKAFDSGFIIAAQINKKIYRSKISRSKYKKFKYSVRLNGKKYYFNPRVNKMIKLYKLTKSEKVKKKATRRRKAKGGSKRVSTKRKSPEQSATLYKIGTVKKGNDGNRWVVKKASNGVKRWVKK
jgi:hypothetical protein